MTHSSSSSGIFFQGDRQPQAVGSSNVNSYGKSSNSIPMNMHSNIASVSGDVSNAVLNSVVTSGPSVGASSLVTDANSGLSGGPHLQRSTSINAESHARLPASPLSFTSNNISISGSSVIDGPSGVHQGNKDTSSHQTKQGHPRQMVSSATSLPNGQIQIGQVSFPNGSRVHGSFAQDADHLSQLHKKPRLDVKQDDILQQQFYQQMLQRPDSMQLQSPTPQFQALMQHQRFRQQQQQQQQQQQLLQSMQPVQRAHLLQQQQQQQLHMRQQLQQQSMKPAPAMKQPSDAGICARRLMQYLYHQRQRPADNTIVYWRKFVTEYYSPRAKKRWCLSLYDNVGQHSNGVFPQVAMDAWQCDICCSKSGRGFEATFEVLPRLNEIKFGSGVIDELLFVDLPRESRFSNGLMMLEYGKAVQESVYEQLRVVREGQLRVIFTPDLKILSWEFCARRHEELLPRRLVAPQVNQLLLVAQKCQSTILESGSDGVSQQDLQTNSNMIVTAGRQLARTLELQSLNDLGFSKRYIRCLQISEVVNSLKDLMDFCRDNKSGAIEGLKNFPKRTSGPKLQLQNMQEMEQMPGIQGLPTDRNTLNKLMPMHPGLSSPMSNPGNQQMLVRGSSPSGSAQAAMALSNYQSLMMRQNSMNSNIQQESSSSFNNNNPNPNGNNGSSAIHGSNVALPGTALQTNTNMLASGFSNSHLLQQKLPNSGNVFQQNHLQNPYSSQGQGLQQQMMQNLLQDMSNNSGGGGGQRPSVSGQSGGNVSLGRDSVRNVGTTSASGPTRSNSFKNLASQGDPSAGGGNVNPGVPQKAPDMTDIHLSDEMVRNISDFAENGFFNDEDLEEGLGFDWKA